MEVAGPRHWQPHFRPSHPDLGRWGALFRGPAQERGPMEEWVSIVEVLEGPWNSLHREPTC